MLLTCAVWLVVLLLILLTVAFFTLFERKFMGLVHTRVGPNKVALLGLIQPILDAVKLLTKYEVVSLRVNVMAYHLSPHMALFFSLVMWVVFPYFYDSFYLSLSFMVFMLVGSLSVFGVLLAGWSSNSKYSLIGSLRSVAQSISYESVFTTLLLAVMVCYCSYSLKFIAKMSSVIMIYLLPIWIFTTLAETHRAPFDFSESESELVSGFNTEYGGVYFAYVFLSEYAVLILSSSIISVVFFSFVIDGGPMLISGLTLCILTMFIWVRVTFCRFRYDKLMINAWKSYLPVSIYILFLFYFVWKDNMN